MGEPEGGIPGKGRVGPGVWFLRGKMEGRGFSNRVGAGSGVVRRAGDRWLHYRG